MGNYWVDKFNVPGSVTYDPNKAIDYILQSYEDQQKRGYWLERDEDGQLVFVSDQSGADHVTVGEDPDGTPVIVYDDSLTTELSVYADSTLGLKRYS